MNNAPSGQSLWAIAQRIMLIAGIVAASFSAGMNWHRIDGHDTAIAALSRQEDQIKADYVRKDVLQPMLGDINNQLAEIRREMSRLADKQDGAPPVPRFR